MAFAAKDFANAIAGILLAITQPIVLTAVGATLSLVLLAALSPRIKRIYFFHWEQPSSPTATWDSGLLNRFDHPRPAYDVLLSWLIKHGIAPAFSFSH